MTVFICGEEPEDIWCAVYDAWMSRLGHKNVRIEPAGWDQNLFCQYREVIVTEEKAQKVIDSIRKKLSEDVYELIYRAALAQDPLRGDKIYRFLIYGFSLGLETLHMLQIPAVYEIFQLNRSVEREYGQWREFIRFSQMKGGVLFGKICPKHDIIALLALYFAERMPSETWIICDQGRNKAVVYQADQGWFLWRTDSKQWQSFLEKETDESEFEKLWHVFHQSIAIRERRNLRCQRNLMPLRYRPYMTEFQTFS